MDDAERQTLVSVRNLLRVAVLLLVLLLLAQSVPPLLSFLSARRVAARIETTEPAAPVASPGQVSVGRGSAGSMRTVLGYGFALNKQSSLEREWVTVNSPPIPAQLVGPVGLATAYKSGSYSGSYRYESSFDVEVKEPLAAVEVKFLTFDVWGDHSRTLSFTSIEDLPIGRKTFKSEWSLMSENEAEEHYASVAYIARVRTKTGRILAADPEMIVLEAKKFSARFTRADLERPSPSPAPSTSPSS